jgi:hypothetical protein
MAITAADIHERLSVVAGAAGNTTAGTPAGSLGKYMSTTDIVDNTSENLFDKITGDENAASTVDYRGFLYLNDHATLALEGAKVWIASEVAGGASVAIGLDTTGVTAKGSAGVQMVTIANELTAPAGVAFSAPTTKTAGLSAGDVAAVSCFGVWVRRTAANTGAVDADGATFRCEGDTAA